MVSKRLSAAAVAAIALMGIAAGPANSAVVIDITQSGANVDVTVSGELNLEGANLVTHQDAFSAGIIPGGDNWYVTAGADGAQDLYELTGVTVPFGTSEHFLRFGRDLRRGTPFSFGVITAERPRSECRPATHPARFPGLWKSRVRPSPT